jgi:endonuclease/exonuclease/phosphatase family metal-dependent hydrolase
VNAYLPGYFLATNSGTDGTGSSGFIRSVIASRFPIVRSQKWLDGVTLVPFGYSISPSTFTRDLFEAEIVVPGWAQNLHVFTTHLKATDNNNGGTSFTNSLLRRAAEASAISNFFVTGFLTTNGNRPYVLTGDMNEDISKPPSGSGHPIERLISAPTGLRLTTPINPITTSNGTYFTAASGNPSSRIDYILPGGLLYSNIAGSQVFRTDKLTPLPPNLFSNDSRTASDHYPVLMSFHNPYDVLYHFTSIVVNTQWVNLGWQSTSGRQYRVETSANLLSWSAASGNLTAAGTNLNWTTNRTGAARFYRIYRLP